MLRRIVTQTTDWTDLPTIARCGVCGETAKYADIDIITPANPETATTVKPTGCPHCLTGSPNNTLEPTLRLVFYG